MTEGRVVPIPVFIDVQDVMTSMKCKKAMAYEHMRRAVGRRPGQRGQLRVPVHVWIRYVDSMYAAPDEEGVPSPLNGPRTECPLRVTHARKPRRASATDDTNTGADSSSAEADKPSKSGANRRRHASNVTPLRPRRTPRR